MEARSDGTDQNVSRMIGFARHDAQRFDLQLARSRDRAGTGRSASGPRSTSGGNSDSRWQLGGSSVMPASVMHQPFALGVFDDERLADLADAGGSSSVDRLLVGQRALEVRLHVLDDRGEVAAAVARGSAAGPSARAAAASCPSQRMRGFTSPG